MSGDFEGVIAVPVVLAIAAPIVVTGIAIAATAAAVTGAVKIGGALYGAYNTRKQRAAEELENSGLVPQIASVYSSMVAESKQIASVYNKQTMRVIDHMQECRNEWEQMLTNEDVRVHQKLMEQIGESRANLARFERERAEALVRDITAVTDAQDRELNLALKRSNDLIEAGIRNMKNTLATRANVSAGYANEYLEGTKLLLKTLRKDYQGQKFCGNEITGIEELLTKGNAVMETAPQAAYAIALDAAEKTLLAINKAENLQQEWLMQYRTALVLAEEIKSMFTDEASFGYMVNGVYLQTEDEAFKHCLYEDLNPSAMVGVSAYEYTYGELHELKEKFDEAYAALHKDDGQELSVEDLYTVIDDFNVVYGVRARRLLHEAKMNFNEALFIDRLEEQLNDALGGGYHSTGSARGGDCHNGEKHIIFERDGNPEEQICVVLRNGGCDDGDGEAVLNTEIDVKCVQDNKISENKRRKLRRRICDYLGAAVEGAEVNLDCVAGTENRLTTDQTAGNLHEVRRKRVERYAR